MRQSSVICSDTETPFGDVRMDTSRVCHTNVSID